MGAAKFIIFFAEQVNVLRVFFVIALIIAEWQFVSLRNPHSDDIA
jgi:hypothetical protein